VTNSTTFVDRSSVIYAAWLNDVNAAVFDTAVNVMQCGATGNGVTDDTTAIQLALAAGAGKTVFLPPPSSSYRVTASLVVQANTALVGANRRTTKILKDFNGDLLTLGDGAGLFSLYLDGNSKTGRGIVVSGTAGGQTVRDCKITDFDGACIDFAATTAGSRSHWENIEAYRTSAGTGTGRYGTRPITTVANGRFEPGNPGRPKGAKNKATRKADEAFDLAFDALQTEDETNLVAWAKANTTDFYKLFARRLTTVADNTNHVVTENLSEEQARREAEAFLESARFASQRLGAPASDSVHGTDEAGLPASPDPSPDS
jgi:polygalacturonase